MKDPADNEVDEMTRRYREASATDPRRPAGATRAAILEQSRLEAAALRAAGVKSTPYGVAANDGQWRLRAVAGLAVVAAGIAVTLQIRHQRDSASVMQAQPAGPQIAANDSPSNGDRVQAVQQRREAGAATPAVPATSAEPATQAAASTFAAAVEKKAALADASALHIIAPVTAAPDASGARAADASPASSASDSAADAPVPGASATSAAGGAAQPAMMARVARDTLPAAALTFEPGSDEPGPNAEPALHDVVAYLVANDGARASIVGDEADDLARRRTAAVRELLIAQGIAAERVTMGGTDAAAAGRVEVRVIK